MIAILYLDVKTYLWVAIEKKTRLIFYCSPLCASSTTEYVSYPKQPKIAIYLFPSTCNNKDIAGKIRENKPSIFKIRIRILWFEKKMTL